MVAVQAEPVLRRFLRLKYQLRLWGRGLSRIVDCLAIQLDGADPSIASRLNHNAYALRFAGNPYCHRQACPGSSQPSCILVIRGDREALDP
jgi:hypothetical protein